MNENITLKHVKKSTSKETLYSLIIMLIFLFAGSLLFYYNDILGSKYQWLFISPAYINKSELSWINSSWGTVLSIHGTIAALSITFMGMFIQQVSEASDKDFVHITRQLVLREYKFYSFCVDAIFGLLFGVFFLVVGGGVIQYALSISCSIYFLCHYVRIFKHLYYITEKKEIIERILLKKMKSVSEFVFSTQENSKRLRLDYDNFISQYPVITTKYETNLNARREIEIKGAYGTVDKIITGFNKNKIKKLASKINSIYGGVDAILFLSPSFHDTSFMKDVYVFHNETSTSISFDKIQPLVKDCFDYTDVSEDLYFYYEIESKITQSTFNSLLGTSSKQLDFCIQTLYLLITSSRSYDVFLNLSRFIYESPSAKNIPEGGLYIFYKELLWKLYRENDDAAVIVFKSMLSLPRFIYDSITYNNFIQESHDFIESTIMYSTNDKYIEEYFSSTIANLTQRQHSALEINTEFLTRKFDTHSLNSSKILSNRQNLFLDATKTLISYACVRLEFLREKYNISNFSDVKDEIKEIATLKRVLLKWLQPKYLEEIYYISDVYDILFSKESKFSQYTDEFDLKEVSGSTVIAVNMEHHRAFALALMFFKGVSYNNALSLIYIDSIEALINKNSISTHFIEMTLNLINSNLFKETIKLLESVDGVGEIVDFNSRLENIKSIFEQLNSKILDVLRNNIINAPYDDELMNTYQEGLDNDLLKSLREIFKLDFTEKRRVKRAIKFDFLIDKRQIIRPLNSEFYSQSHSIQASEVLRVFISRLMNEIDESKSEFTTINNPNLLPEGVKLISINSLDEDFERSFKFYRGIRYIIKEPHKIFNMRGFYYIDLNDCYSFYSAQDKISSASFGIPNKELLESYNLEFNEANTKMHASVDVSLLLTWLPKNTQRIYFISSADCLRHLEQEANGLPTDLVRRSPDL
ncbi:hypothetical protein [Lelliottia amnigena]|uniref:hypothetical protein n=1 Tax=Lelliottia amnigena TaxID=61646 RepID=UPI00293BC1BB|nr:hypothetical protein [Lelliottia amnigena]